MVHPRVCGEHWPGSARPATSNGSSPRVRGTPTARPEARGVVGSSPRVRGTRPRAAPQRRSRRFIPACAGNTMLSSVPEESASAVHPRVCGEHCSQLANSDCCRGSSPRVRGTPAVNLPDPIDQWFIPACAGNTRWNARMPIAIPVHPRVCGEHDHERVTCYGTRGSSPRVRGTRENQCPSRTRSWFIPACAGNTSEHVYRSTMCMVHPRVCGEHASPRRIAVNCIGSSPRVRGTLLTAGQFRLL